MLGTKIKLFREANQLSQVQLAHALHVSKQSISNWENNNILPSIEMLVQIADFFSVTTDSLLERDDRQFIEVSGLTVEEIAHIQLLIQDIKT